jgi:hypothetical protein
MGWEAKTSPILWPRENGRWTSPPISVLKNVKTYEAWYKVKHASPALLKKAVYGLPELYRKDIPGIPLIANPGCYATTTILALTRIGAT